MAIHIDSCGDRETIVVNTRFNVYELIVLREEEGAVLVRGGCHFTEFSRVLFLGSTTEGGRLHPRTIDVGLRMAFMCGDQLVSTSAVQSVSKGRSVPSQRTKLAQSPALTGRKRHLCDRVGPGLAVLTVENS